MQITGYFCLQLYHNGQEHRFQNQTVLTVNRSTVSRTKMYQTGAQVLEPSCIKVDRSLGSRIRPYYSGQEHRFQNQTVISRQEHRFQNQIVLVDRAQVLEPNCNKVDRKTGSRTRLYYSGQEHRIQNQTLLEWTGAKALEPDCYYCGQEHKFQNQTDITVEGSTYSRTRLYYSGQEHRQQNQIGFNLGSTTYSQCPWIPPFYQSSNF